MRRSTTTSVAKDWLLFFVSIISLSLIISPLCFGSRPKLEKEAWATIIMRTIVIFDHHLFTRERRKKEKGGKLSPG